MVCKGFYFSLVIGGLILVYVNARPLLPNIYLSEIHNYLFALCTAVGVGLFFHVVTMNAGVVTQENVDFYKTQFPYDNVLYKEKECPECKLPKPARSKHCRICNRCVARFDHHCIWLNNCVGINNTRWFIIFLLHHAMLCLYGAFIAFFALMGVIAERGLMYATYVDVNGQHVQASMGLVFQYVLGYYAGVCATAAYCFLLGVTLFLFGMFHVHLVAKNTTTNESFKWSDAQDAWKRDGGKGQLVNGYHIGILRNFIQVFLPQKLVIKRS